MFVCFQIISYKPSVNSELSANWDTLNAKIEDIENPSEITTDGDLRDINIVELHQSDFTKGTYRITKSGTYKIMEDIQFDFKPNYEDPNAPGFFFAFFFVFS